MPLDDIDEQRLKNSLVEFSMAFVGASFDKNNFGMKWRSVASDTKEDLYGDHMTPQLFKSFITNQDKPVPDTFRTLVCDSAWDGGKPYVSLAHYSSLDGKGIAGMVDENYIDGVKFKSKGHFNDTPLGRACYKALCRDLSQKTDKPIRQSIGFLDLAHQHGENGPIFERKSCTDVCPQCESGEGNKYYLEGILIHEAMTRVPVNPRSEMEVERSMGKITRKSDAESIVEDSAVVDELEKQSALVGRSVLVEMSDTDEETGVVEEAPEQVEGLAELPPDAVVDESEVVVENADQEGASSAQKARSKKYGIAVLAQGHVTKPGKWASVPDSKWGDPVNYRYPMPDENHIRNAASQFAQEKGSYRGKDTVGARIKRQEKSKSIGKEAKKENSMTKIVEKTGTVDLPNKPSDDDLTNLPYGGSVALDLTPKTWARGSADESLESLWTQLKALASNIYKRPGVDKVTTMNSLLDQVKPLITVKSAVLADPIQSLVKGMLEQKALTIPTDEKLRNIQPLYEALGQAIQAEVQEVPAGSEASSDSAVLRALADMKSTLEQQSNEIAVLRAQLSKVPQNRQQVVIPSPRSMSGLQANQLVQQSQAAPKKQTLHDLVARNAGIDPNSFKAG